MIDVIVGGQYGSEGKGQLAAHIAHEYDLLVRVGGPNAVIVFSRNPNRTSSTTYRRELPQAMLRSF